MRRRHSTPSYAAELLACRDTVVGSDASELMVIHRRSPSTWGRRRNQLQEGYLGSHSAFSPGASAIIGSDRPHTEGTGCARGGMTSQDSFTR